MEQDLKQLDDIFNAESSADKIGSSTITQLEEKINLYKIALDNATRESEEFYRVQTKLVNTQKALNEAIKNRDYTTESEDKATEKENAKKLQAAEALAKKKKEIEEQLAKKIQEINNQVQISSLKEDEKEITTNFKSYYPYVKNITWTPRNFTRLITKKFPSFSTNNSKKVSRKRSRQKKEYRPL